MFTPDGLADEFGADAGSPAGGTVRHFHHLLSTSSSPVVAHSFETWRASFAESLAFGDPGSAKWTGELASQYEADPGEPAKLLFAVHTYYALVIKLLVPKLVAGLNMPSSTATREICGSIEDPDWWSSQGLVNFTDGGVFGWYVDGWNGESADIIAALAAKFAKIDVRTVDEDHRSSRDLLKPLYNSLVPAAVRHDLGEYYTPDWLADLSLDEVGYGGDPRRRILDPACGSGTYLVTAINRIKSWCDQIGDDCDLEPSEVGRLILENVIGFDLNPLAALAARANYLLVLRPFFDALPRCEIPVYHGDAIAPVDASAESALTCERVDYVVGNPPWINWQNLPASHRDQMKPQWESYGLFSLSGAKARLGGGKKDLSMLFTYACCDRYLKDGGTLGFLITRSVLKSKGAGDGFRRFRYPKDGQTVYLRPLSVDDFTDFEPFDGATTQTALLCLHKTVEPFEYPVPYRRWAKTRRGRICADADLREAKTHMEPAHLAARPVDPDHDASPWLTAPPEALDGICKVIGSSDYQAYEGVNSGGLNACYWVREVQRRIDGFTTIENLHDVGRIKVDRLRCEVESERVYPLLRSGDLDRWQAHPRDCILLAQDPETRCGIDESAMKEEYPRTYAYFKHFEGDPDDVQRGTLRGRSLFRRYFKPSDPFYSMYGVGPYTMSPWKVCWPRIDTRLRAVVVGPNVRGRVVLPQETITFVPLANAEEAHYFCALFNSSPADALVRCYSTGKGFASAHILDTLAIPKFDADHQVHRELSEMSRGCHDAADAGNGDEADYLHKRIDSRSSEIWNLSKTELTGIQTALEVL